METQKKSAHKTGVPTSKAARSVEVRTSKAGSAAEFNCHRQVVAAQVLQASSDAIGRARDNRDDDPGGRAGLG